MTEITEIKIQETHRLVNPRHAPMYFSDRVLIAKRTQRKNKLLHQPLARTHTKASAHTRAMTRE